MTVITDEVSRFIYFQNTDRGLAGQEVQQDYWLEGVTPVGANDVEGISGIAAGASTIDLALAGGKYNAIILDGTHSTTASAAGADADNYAFSVNTGGGVTILDENTGNTQTVTGAAYIVFDAAFRNSDNSYQSIYFVAGGSDAQIAALYNAAFGRQPDLPGLEYYGVRIANGQMDLHQAAVYFLASPEFKTDYPALTAAADNGGPNDQAFITELYGNILHRTPTAAEVAYFVDALQGTLTTGTGAPIAAADRAQLLVYFAESPENQKDISGWLINTSTGYADSGVPAATSDATVHVVGVSAPHSPVVG